MNLSPHTSLLRTEKFKHSREATLTWAHFFECRRTLICVVWKEIHASRCIVYSSRKHLLALIIWNALSSIFKPCSLGTNKQAVPPAIQRQQGIRQFVKVEKVMEASWVCPAAGQMICAPRLPVGYAEQSVGSDCWRFPPTGLMRCWIFCAFVSGRDALVCSSIYRLIF